ncbi:thiolase family protein [Pseudohongiella spirulinae]|uniref:Acetyl-CoA acetyltransferase n=1 Tax=Pseudohongiella spirulinae TaxID=1249552 RepID=A0A0S2KBP6_9GAMM|nr:acetyl-CoA C-acyltransferase [Pseudohongiella spirulinae]ALO45539.1 acetyl-CoA acetyltransferase [Pseudohongiella spirulinae]
MSKDHVVILGGARTPIGGFQGVFSNTAAPALGVAAARAALERAGLNPSDNDSCIDDVLMGCVLPAGLAQAPARQVALGAGLAVTTPCTTVNKMCGSGMKTVMMGVDQILAGNADTVLAGGIENMTLAPYLIPKARGGLRLGHGELKDHMFLDGLEDAYTGRLMGSFAQETADKHGLTRKDMDDYAIASLSRAQTAIKEGWFDAESVSLDVKAGRNDITVTHDEQPGKASVDKIPTLRPAFAADGTVTAANSSSISDGAAAVVLMRESVARDNNLKPMARILAQASHARHPSEFTVAPIGAIEKVLTKTGWSAADVDLFEINEAFAMVPLLAMRELGLPHDKVNIHGGACALGHPVGASGTRIIVTLMYALQKLGKKRGIASLCIGGGEAVAIAIEMIDQ